MNDQEMKQKLALYLEATERLAAQSSSGQHVDVEEQKKIFQSVITDMGVSVQDREELEKVGKQFCLLGKESYQAANYEQSIHFCSKSLEILPFEVEVLELLMDSHLQLSQVSEAKNVARSILKIKPSHKAALRITYTLPTSSSKSEKYVWSVLAVIFVFILGLLMLTLHTLKPSSNQEKPQEEAIIIPDIKTEKNLPKKKNLTTPDLTLQTDNIPIAVFGMVDGITLENRDTELAKYNGSFSYHLRLVLTNVGKNEIGEIEGELTLFDDQDSVIEQNLFEAKRKFKPVLRPGESYGIEKLIFKKLESIPNITKAHFEIKKMKQNPAPKSISKEPVELEWQNPQPKQFSIKVERRISEKKLGTDSIISKVYARSEYEITNTGTGVIKLLQLQDDFYDEKNNHLGKGIGYATLRSYPYIAPNETRVISIASDIPKRATSVRTSVVSIK